MACTSCLKPEPPAPYYPLQAGDVIAWGTDNIRFVTLNGEAIVAESYPSDSQGEQVICSDQPPSRVGFSYTLGGIVVYLRQEDGTVTYLGDCDDDD